MKKPKKHVTIKDKLTLIDSINIQKYLQEIRLDKQCKPLTKDEEYELFKEYKKTGSKIIKDIIIKSNLRWVISISKQYEYSKVYLEDIIAEGNIGLINAIDKFNPELGNSFLTYATWYIRQSINDFLNGDGSDIAQPANRYNINKILKISEQQLKKEGIEYPNNTQLIERYMLLKEQTDPILTESILTEIINNKKGFISQEHQLSNSDEEIITIGSFFKSGIEYMPDFEINKTEKINEIQSMLTSILTNREKEIIEWIFGLNGKESKTLEQTAEYVNLTRERVGQLLTYSIIKLRENKSKKIKEICSNKEISYSFTIDENLIYF